MDVQMDGADAAGNILHAACTVALPGTQGHGSNEIAGPAK
jgi:hypothetical protein